MIPREFKLVNKSWKVRIVTTKQLQRHCDTHWNADCDPGERLEAKSLKGLCEPSIGRIFLNKDAHKTEEDLLHTYFHELYHALLFGDGQSGHNEEVVDRMGALLHQYMTTKRGEA